MNNTNLCNQTCSIKSFSEKINNYTENDAISYGTTNDPRLDLFFKSVNKSCEFPYESKYINDLIEKSWEVSPLDTMKIIMNWRDCRGGKGDNNSSISALLYIESKYPKWFQTNFETIPEYGSWLDLIKLWHYVSKNTKNLIMSFIIDTLDSDIMKPKNESVTLLAKWIPSENSKWDRIKKPRFIIELCKDLFQTDQVSSDLICILRKDILTPLRKRIDIVETNICQMQPIAYENVPSLAMNKYKKVFLNRDPIGFNEYLGKVIKKEKTINSSQLFPHDLVRQYLNGLPEDTVIEEQWLNIKKKYEFINSIAVCDVSGSMEGTPMEVSIALGLLCLCENRLITFSEIPELHFVPNGSLYSQVQSVKNMMWGSNTNFEAVMNLVLGLSVVIERVYIFSDMQFDKAMGHTNIDFMKKKFSKAKLTMPQIIFWNLRGSTKDFPATSEDNIIILSGYYPSLINFINNTNINPLNVMLNIINDPRYDFVVSPQ